MKTKKIATPEEWFKEFTPENVDVNMLLCSVTNNTTTDNTNQSGGTNNNDGDVKVTSKSTGIYENNFSYNPFE